MLIIISTISVNEVDNNNLYNETVDGNHSSGNDKNIYNNQSTGIENTYSK